MWKNLVLLAIISLTFVFEGFSQQFPSEIWHNGKAAFTDNSLLQGRIKYDLDNNLIQVEVDGTIKTYTAQSVVSFENLTSIMVVLGFSIRFPTRSVAITKHPYFLRY